MKIISDMAFVSFMLGIGISIGWAGITRGFRWKDVDAFHTAVEPYRKISIYWYVAACLLAIIRFRPDILVAGLFIAAGVLKLFYELAR